MTKIQQKFQVVVNSKISDVFGKLNSVQKQTVSLFDTDRNGILDAKEAKAFNSTVFAEKNDRIDCWLQLKSGKKTKASVKKADIDTTVLKLGINEVATKRVGNKRVHYKEAQLKGEKADSNKKIIEKRFAENSKGYEYESQDRAGNVKYSREVSTEYMDYEGPDVKEHVILNKFGEVVETSKAVDSNGENGAIIGHAVERENSTKYYDVNNKLVGSEEKLKNGRYSYKNAKGEVMYQTKGEDKGTIYYDKNGAKLYKIGFPNNDSERMCKVEIYNKDGAVIKTKSAYDGNYWMNDFDYLNGINKNPIDCWGHLNVYK